MNLSKLKLMEKRFKSILFHLKKIVSMHRRMKEIRSGFPSNFKNKPTMAICDADGKEYWAYSGIHNENSKPYKNNKKKENLKNVVLKADKKNKSLKR